MTKFPLSSHLLLTTAELAGYLRVPRSTLYGWRYRGVGPPAIRVGRHLRYRTCDVERWLELQTEPDIVGLECEK